MTWRKERLHVCPINPVYKRAICIMRSWIFILSWARHLASRQGKFIQKISKEGRKDLRDDLYEMTTLECILNKRNLPCLNCSRHYILTVCYDHSNKILDFVKGEEFFSRLVTMTWSVITFHHYGYLQINMLDEGTTNFECHENHIN
jgi:hypothetical protein